jgi:hypothetical protein
MATAKQRFGKRHMKYGIAANNRSPFARQRIASTRFRCNGHSRPKQELFEMETSIRFFRSYKESTRENAQQNSFGSDSSFVVRDSGRGRHS